MYFRLKKIILMIVIINVFDRLTYNLLSYLCSLVQFFIKMGTFETQPLPDFRIKNSHTNKVKNNVITIVIYITFD